ncbi:myosin-6-like [Dorcoceras hygrometricum]|uniref:Myosin-6-like n=1 Tax=Dorcoceras hygrometricum TaxID=472368 RepID=A0A2Z7AP92_9LAMI|nr:myosin-6-like [Dorcoceras hygrometricum]
MKVEYRLLHDIVAKALCAKAGSFDIVTSEKFDLMVAISAGLKVLFQTLVAMVHKPTKQSQGFAVQLSVLLERLVKADLGESVKLHSLKVLNKRSVHTYMKKNLGVCPAGETSKKATVEKRKKKKEKVVPVVKKQVMVVKKPMEARSQAAPVKSKSGTSSDTDSLPLAKLGAAKKGQAAPKQKQVVESSDSESMVSLPMVKIMKKQRTQRTKPAQRTAGDQVGFNPGPIPNIPDGADDASTTGEHVECTDKMEIEAVNNEHAVVVRYGPAHPAQQPIISAGKEANNSADSTQDGPQQIIVPEPQANIDTAKELTSLKDIVSSLGSKVDRIKDDTFIAKHTTLQFKRQLETKIDGLENSLRQLETKIDGLENSLVRHFADSQQNLPGDIALLKSQVAEMVECLKEIRDTKKGEGTSSKKRRLL